MPMVNGWLDVWHELICRFLSVGDDLTQMLPIHAYTQQAKDTLLRTLRLDLVSDARELMLQPLEDVATSPGKSSVGFSEHESSNIKENAQGFLNAISAPFQKQKIVDRRPQTNEADVALLSMTGDILFKDLDIMQELQCTYFDVYRHSPLWHRFLELLLKRRVTILVCKSLRVLSQTLLNPFIAIGKKHNII